MLGGGAEGFHAREPHRVPRPRLHAARLGLSALEHLERYLRAVQRGEAGCEEVAEAAAVEEELLAVRARAEHAARDAREHEAAVVAPLLAPQLRVERHADLALALELTQQRRNPRRLVLLPGADHLRHEGHVHALPQPRGRRLGEAGDEEGRQHRLPLVRSSKGQLEAGSRKGAVAVLDPRLVGRQRLRQAVLREWLARICVDRVGPAPRITDGVRRHPVVLGTVDASQPGVEPLPRRAATSFAKFPSEDACVFFEGACAAH
mmetsp:Transcript_7777/g.18265  ORF Transcript_7777/g.18265 Transcript_7777/m.18265 type:complete len:262 (-) Transcript_7777:10-795(-)